MGAARVAPSVEKKFRKKMVTERYHVLEHSSNPIEFSLNVCTEFAEFSDKNIFQYSKMAWTYHLLCKRPGCYHSTSKTHMRARIFKLTIIHASVIYQNPWIHRIQWIPVPFRENSNVWIRYIYVFNLKYQYRSASGRHYRMNFWKFWEIMALVSALKVNLLHIDLWQTTGWAK